MIMDSNRTHYIENLKVEYSSKSIYTDLEEIHFSWENISDKRNWKQTAYQIQIFDDKEKIESSDFIWNSNKIESSSTVTSIKTKKFESGKIYFWKVKTWDKDGISSKYSDGKKFYIAFLNKGDWRAKWVSKKNQKDNPMPVFRKKIDLSKKIKSALVFASGLGHFELRLNGDKVSEYVLEPGWTDYRKTVFYSMYDVTSMLDSGENVIGIMLGNGMYNVQGGRYVYYKRTFGKPKFILQLNIEYMDGSKDIVISDESWDCKDGPIVFSSIYGGEDYDARKEDDWDKIECEIDESWEKAVYACKPNVKLRAQLNPPLKVMESYKPVWVKQIDKNTYIYDFGQNLSGWVKLSVRGQRGDKITIKPGELLKKNGYVNQDLTRDGYLLNYVLKGEGSEVWNPRFTYYGYRYIQIEVSSESNKLPEIEWVESLFIYPDVEKTGEFKCSNELFNKIHKIINMAILSNMKSVFTDCPTREKLGWIEQTHLVGPAIMYNYEVRNLYKKISMDMKDSQRDNGLVADIAPEYFVFGYHEGFVDSPEWGSAVVLDPWYTYIRYGDKNILQDNYDTMAKYVEYLKGKATHNRLHHGLGDWLDIGPNPPYSHHTPVSITATAIYYYDIKIMQNTAKILGKQNDVIKYKKLAKEVNESYNTEFFDNQVNRYAVGSQTANAMSLFLDMQDEEYTDKIVDYMTKEIKLRRYHITGGDVGHSFIYRALSKYKKDNIVLKMLKKTDNPSYGYQVNNKATTLTEAWDGPNISNPHGSQNHLMLGAIDEWFYSALAGIKVFHENYSENRIIIKPYITRELESVNASYSHISGKVEVRWEFVEKNKLKFTVRIPCNLTAEIFIPADGKEDIKENDIQIEDVMGVEQIVTENENVIIIAGSGTYEFDVKYNK